MIPDKIIHIPCDLLVLIYFALGILGGIVVSWAKITWHKRWHRYWEKEAAILKRDCERLAEELKNKT